MKKQVKHIKSLYSQYCGGTANYIRELTPAGSPREYYRITVNTGSVIGTYNPDEAEIYTSLYLSEHLLSKGIKVPKVLASDPGKLVYLQEDVGDVSLFSILEKNRFVYDPSITRLFTKILKDLVKIQTFAAEGLDPARLYPVERFDESSMLFDLSYFREYFLRTLALPFDEDRLEQDFQKFAGFLSGAGVNHFMYRDFQSRNIFIRGEEIYYIDFQGARKGPLQYDVASLLNQSRIHMQQEMREFYLDVYLTELDKATGIKRGEFMKYYPGFGLLRLLQNFGAYGFRGIMQGKDLFISGITPAIENLGHFLQNDVTLTSYPEMKNCLVKLFSMYNAGKKPVK
jgi:aminoglycoside/choline kinase family phosphotransferase